MFYTYVEDLAQYFSIFFSFGCLNPPYILIGRSSEASEITPPQIGTREEAFPSADFEIPVSSIPSSTNSSAVDYTPSTSSVISTRSSSPSNSDYFEQIKNLANDMNPMGDHRSPVTPRTVQDSIRSPLIGENTPSPKSLSDQVDMSSPFSDLRQQSVVMFVVFCFFVSYLRYLTRCTRIFFFFFWFLCFCPPYHSESILCFLLLSLLGICVDIHLFGWEYFGITVTMILR